jgi:hypothetical protein
VGRELDKDSVQDDGFYAVESTDTGRPQFYFLKNDVRILMFAEITFLFLLRSFEFEYGQSHLFYLPG